MRILKHLPLLSLAAAIAVGPALIQTVEAQTVKAPDITRQPTLYVVPYAHLDTQWRWEFPQSISEYLLKTMRVNFDLIDKYPHYIFNWTGANRYRLMKEYFPSDYARVKKYVDAGRWYPAGSSMEEGDVNLPSAEGIMRQVLYGNTYFRKEFGKASAEYMLPDCFGFPASLPSILAHAGVKGFSTQKLSAAWQPAPKVGGPDSPEQTPMGIPFNVGIWEGPDGKTILAALNPGGYGSNIATDISKSPAPGGRGGRGGEEDWVKRVELDGDVTGVFADYKYVGTGDTGGATQEYTARMLEAIVTKSETVLPVVAGRGGGRGRGGAAPPPAPAGPPVRVGDGPLTVIPAAADQMFLDIKPEMTSRMPRWKGDLELINHSAGSLTSEAYHKRWNRKNELLAAAAEEASVAAAWMGGRPYPQPRLNDAWTLVMGGHFHDTGAGTATPQAYEFAQNDDVIAMNQFAGVLTNATESVASAMDTETRGTPVVIYNPLNIAREDVVEADGVLPADAKEARVTGPDGKEVPAQVEGGKVLFLAKAPSVGYAVYDVEPAAEAMASTLKVNARQGGGRGGRGGGGFGAAAADTTPTFLENDRYRVTLENGGDVSSIFDKSINRELLSGPIRLAISNDHPTQWPAWNMDFDQEQAPPRAYVRGGNASIKENGPARVTLEVTHTNTEGSRFVQTISLSAGDAGNRVEFGNSIDWKTLYANLKATFPLSASNEDATYNWGLGTVHRSNASERQFEVASHQWIDLTDRSGAFGATILTDCKNGSDKPDNNTIRLTLLRTPGVDASYTDQANQDWGHHEFVFGIAGHRGGWHDGQTDWQGYRLNQPLIAFTAAKHSGRLGKSFSLLTVSNPRIQVMALKKAEIGDEIVLRMVEMDGRPQENVVVKFAGPITAAREVNGQELPVAGTPAVTNGALAIDFTGYQPRTFALKLGAAPTSAAAVKSQPVTLTYDRAVASNDDTKTVGGFDAKGNAMPAEMLPAELWFNAVQFKLAPAGTGKANAVTAKGQTIALPAGQFNRVYLLAASSDGDQKAAFKAGDHAVDLTVQNWGGFVGQWDTRVWNTPGRDWAVSANHAVWPPAAAGGGGGGGGRGTVRYPEDFVGMTPGYVKPADLAWYCSHHHTADGLNEPYQYSYLFAYAIDLPPGARTLTLPDNEKIRVLAVSVADEGPLAKPAQALYDTLGRTEPGPLVAAK